MTRMTITESDAVIRTNEKMQVKKAVRQGTRYPHCSFRLSLGENFKKDWEFRDHKQELNTTKGN